MYEVEVKIEADHGRVKDRLEALSAEPLAEVRQQDTYYDHPVRSFAETDEALRLRRESTASGGSPTATLTYKGPRVDEAAKAREEVETDLGDQAAARAILSAVGFEPAAVVEKERERYRLDGFTVALDRVHGLGQFVEVEAAGEATDVGTLREAAFDCCRRLGLDPGDSIKTSYLALLVSAEGDELDPGTAADG